MQRRIMTLMLALLCASSGIASKSVDAAPAAPLTIPLIQGVGLSSPYAGQQLRGPLRGCVTGVTAEGFFLQDPTGDGDPRTSDGIYVYRYSSWRNPRKLEPGDLIEISRYKVMEFYGQTEVAGLSNDKNESYRIVGDCRLPAPVRVDAPIPMDRPPTAAYEPLEGQRVMIDLSASVVGPTQRYESRHPAGDPEITLAPAGSPLYGTRIPTELLAADVGTITLTGGLGVDLPMVNTFDRVEADDLTGILAYQFGRYVVLVENAQALRVSSGGLAPGSLPAAGAEEWTLCSFNAENLFDAVDDRDGDMGAWAPADAAVYRRQMERRAVLLRDRLGGCVALALQEVEGKDAVWEDLARALGPSYRYDYWESADARDITAGLLYDAQRVELLESRAVPVCGAADYGVDARNAIGPRSPDYACAPGKHPLYDRAPYVADLLVANEAGDRRMEVRLVVVHLKSKRGAEAENLPRRVAQARHVASLLDAPNAAAVGDFNDTLSSEPLAQFGGRVNLFERYALPDERYTYIYNGRSQAVDHIVLTPGLEGYLVEGGAAHVNADFAEPLAGQEGRTSDHDPVVARFFFRPSGLSDALIGAATGAALGSYHHLSRLK